MNENLNLVEILKDCPKGTKLYSPLFGQVSFEGIDYDDKEYPITTKYNVGYVSFTENGRHDFCIENQECMIFPSKEVRTWDNFKPKKQKFDPKTLQPFDKVLAFFDGVWCCDLYSHYSESKDNICVGVRVRRVIPYNDETKHLVGTTEEAPEYYRYWED